MSHHLNTEGIRRCKMEEFTMLLKFSLIRSEAILSMKLLTPSDPVDLFTFSPERNLSTSVISTKGAQSESSLRSREDCLGSKTSQNKLLR